MSHRECKAWPGSCSEYACMNYGGREQLNSHPAVKEQLLDSSYLKKTHDPVNAPEYYTRLSPEPIDVIEAWGLGFHLAQVVKYVARAGHKTMDPTQDLLKARFYLDRAIGRAK